MIVDRSTIASNPGDIKVNFLRLAINKPTKPLLFLLIFCALLAGIITSSSFMISILLFFFMLLAAVFSYLQFNFEKERFALGDVNISKILSLTPPLIAVTTDLRNSINSKEYPVVKIVQIRVPKLSWHEWKVGDYFASACLFTRGSEVDRWVDVEPYPLSFATSDQQIIEHHNKMLEGLSEVLDLRLSLIEKPYKKGLYFVDSNR